MSARDEHPPPPYGAYAAILGAFLGVVAATRGLERALHRPEHGGSPLELVVLAGATFKAARVVSRERLGSIVREPFVDVEERAEDAVERPAGGGFRRALGELVTCSRCSGTWAAAGLVAANAVVPRFGRHLTWTLAAGAANDFLQAAFVELTRRAGGGDPSG